MITYQKLLLRCVLYGIFLTLLFASPLFAVQNVQVMPGSVSVGDDVTLSFDFEQNYQVADCWLYLDLNQSGTVDSSDMLVVREKFWDNDGWDDNPANYQYARVFVADEIPPVAVHFIFLVEDGGGAGTATFVMNPVTSSTSLSGTVTEPANVENLTTYFAIMMGGGEPEYFYLGLTDASGHYTIAIPDSLAGYMGVFLASDVVDVVPLWTNSAMEMFSITGHVTGHDVEMIPVTAWIYGTVEDETGASISDGYLMQAEFDGPSEAGFCRNGWYHIGVTEGDYDVSGNQDQLRYDYLNDYQTVEISAGDSTRVDIVFYSANSTISGTVYLDGVPVSRIRVDGSCSQGGTYAYSDHDGNYSLHISDQVTGYSVDVSEEDIPPGYHVLEEYENVSPGAAGIDFHLVEITGGVSGTLTVQAGDPTPDYTEFWVWGEERESGDTYVTTVGSDSTYEMRLPEGMYELRLGQPYPPPYADVTYLWLPQHYDSVEVSTVVLPGYDFELNYAHARLEGELTGLSQFQELMIVGWSGTAVMEYLNVTLAGQDFSYGMRICEGTWHLIPPEVEGYQANPQGYSFVVTEDDTLFGGYDFHYTSASVSLEPSGAVASQFRIGACYPNPFNSTVAVTFRIPVAGEVGACAYNVLGQRVDEFFRGELDSGVHRITWEPQDLATGIYFLELNWQGEVQVAKVMYHK
jgi:hypothetical protein